jgi:S1-C subfamily serine protease
MIDFLQRNKIPLLLLAFAGAWWWYTNEPAEVAVAERWDGPVVSTAPVVDEQAIGRPVFADGSIRGTAFILDWNEHPYLVSAYHVVGLFPGVISLKKEAVLLAVAERPLWIKGSNGEAEGNSVSTPHDMSVVPVTSLPVASRHFKPALKPPRVGQPVWLCYLPLSGSTPRVDQPMQCASAAVTRSTNKALEFLFDKAPVIDATSGAPVVDQDGDVVGINVGQVLGDGKARGYATPYSSLVEGLTKHGT